MKQEKPLQYVFMPPIETRETEELIGIAYSDPGAWQPRAVELACAELDRRGVTPEQRMTVLLRWKAQAEAAEREYRAWLDGNAQQAYGLDEQVAILLLAPFILMGKMHCGPSYSELKRDNFQRKYRRRLRLLIAGVACWALLVWVLGSAGGGW